MKLLNWDTAHVSGVKNNFDADVLYLLLLFLSTDGLVVFNIVEQGLVFSR